jgi:DNA-binding response OmpR family regulator
MNDVWDHPWFGETKTLDVHIAALRRRLGDDPDQAGRITTIRGVGYRLEVPRAEEA